MRQSRSYDKLFGATIQSKFSPLATAAFYHGTLGNNMEEAERLLEETQQIAERGPMPLYLADVHLHRARLFGTAMRDKGKEMRDRFPDIDPKAELAEARRLIEKHGYWRRKEELEDAKSHGGNLASDCCMGAVTGTVVSAFICRL